MGWTRAVAIGIVLALGALLPTDSFEARAFEARARAVEECFGVEPTIVGSPGGDLIYGTSGSDVIVGRGGADVIDGRGGMDVICGGDGDDQIYGGEGIDFLVGDEGADTLRGGPETDFLLDVLVEGQQILPLLLAEPVDDSSDALFGDGGADFLAGEGGDDLLDGGAGSDTVLALAIYAPVVIDIPDGVMTSTYSGTDTLSGVENAIGTFFDDVLLGDDGPNILGGTFGADRVVAGNGGDIVYSAIDGAQLIGGSDQAADLLWVSLLEESRVDLTEGTVRSLRHAEDVPDQITGFEHVIGTPYDDILIGDDGINEIGGVGGADRIRGRGGDDTILADGPDYIRKIFKDGRRGGRDFVDGGGGSDLADGGPQRDGCVNVEKQRSCESEDVPASQAECPDLDPFCNLPIPPLSLHADPSGVLRSLVYLNPELSRSELRFVQRMLRPVLVAPPR